MSETSVHTGTGLRMAAITLAVGLLGAAPVVAQSAPPKLNDAQIAHVAVTANAVDVEVGQLAKAHAASAAVRDFAEMMIRDHNAVNAKAGELAKKLNVTPQDNVVSQSLRSGEKDIQGKLSKLTGAAFDRAYMDREVAYHQAVIDAVDGVLVPQTQNGELKSLLQQVRPALVAHLEKAKSVRSSLK